MLSKAINKTFLHKPDNLVDLYVDTITDKLTTIRTSRRFCNFDRMNYENLPQPIWICGQYSLRRQN